MQSEFVVPGKNIGKISESPIVLRGLAQSDILDEVGTYVHVLSVKAGCDPPQPFPFAKTPRRLPAYPLGSSSQCQPPASADICWFVICEWPRNYLKMTLSSFDLKRWTQFSGRIQWSTRLLRQSELIHELFSDVLAVPKSQMNYELTPPNVWIAAEQTPPLRSHIPQSKSSSRMFAPKLLQTRTNWMQERVFSFLGCQTMFQEIKTKDPMIFLQVVSVNQSTLY